MLEGAVAPDQSRLVLNNDMNELGRMTQWILEVCTASGVSEKTAFALQLCLEEAVTNIMRHSESIGRASKIVMSIALERADVVLTIEDDGGPFDPTAFAARPRAQSLEQASVGGLGIGLMRRFAREIEYRRDTGHNHLRLTLPRA